MIKLLPLIFCCSCSFLPVKKGEEQSAYEELRSTADTYLELVKEETDEHGFVYTRWCDSLTFTALLSASGHVAEIESARRGDRWYRRPSHDCFDRGESGSSISRDSLLAVTYWAYRSNKPGVLRQIADYGLANDWIMGEGDISATYFTPHMRMILLKAYEGLTGEGLDVGLAGYLWAYSEGYRAHLTILQALLLSEIEGGVAGEVFDILAKNYERNPSNPLYSFAYHKFTDGDYTETISLLADESHWPRDRLPDYRNHCDEWVVQREAGPDWEPCSRKRQHVGGPLIFLADAIRREYDH